MSDRLYEALIIVKATGTDAEIAQHAARLEDGIKKLGGRIASTQSLGRRRLAYRIARQTEGSYHLIAFHLAPEHLEPLQRQWRLSETGVRSLILSRSQPPEAASAPKPATAATAAAVAA